MDVSIVLEAFSFLYLLEVCCPKSCEERDIPEKPVAVNFHQLNPWNQPQLPKKNGTLGFPAMNQLYNLAPTSNGKFEDLPAPSSLGGVETLRISKDLAVFWHPNSHQVGTPYIDGGYIPGLMASPTRVQHRKKKTAGSPSRPNLDPLQTQRWPWQ